MEYILIRGCSLILPGRGGISTLSRWLHETQSPANHKTASKTGISVPCGEGSTRGMPVFAPGLSELYMHGVSEGGSLLFPGAAGPRRCPKGKLATLATRRFHEAEAIINQSMGLGFQLYIRK